jgi:hypothetical protein
MAKVRRVFLLVLIVALVSVTFISCNPATYTLSTSSTPETGGIVSPTSGTYHKNVEVDVTATPASGYRFDHWEGSDPGASQTVRLVMDGNKELTAHFTKTYTLSASSEPAGSGTISPNGGTYDEGEEVALAATPAQYYGFNGWSGDASGSSDHVTITMDSNKTVVASFVKLTYTVQTHVDASGGGTIDSSGGTFEAGAQVTITATPASGYRFEHWGGSTTETTNPLNLVVDSDKSITAHFIRVYTLTVSMTFLNPAYQCGSVSPAGGVYDAETTVTLTASVLFPCSFAGWVGTNDESVNPTTVTMNADKWVEAHFSTVHP